MKYRVWIAVRPADIDSQSSYVGRTDIVIYEGDDRRHAKRVARGLSTAWIMQRDPSIAVVESGWEVVE